MNADAAGHDSPAAAPVATEETPVFLMDGTRATSRSRRISPHDFRNPTTISQSDLRVFEVLYQKYAQSLAARLSTFLRMECTLKITRLTSLPFSEFCQSLPNPSCITLFSLDELRGVGVLDVGLPLALAMTDRLLGGKGRAPSAERPLTEIEMALLDDALQMILAAWSEAWANGEARWHLKIIGNETDSTCLPAPSTNEVFVVLALELSMGETSGALHLGVPFSMLEAPVRKMQESHHHVADKARPKQVQWRRQYAGIEVPVVAEWKIREMPLVETLQFREGDIIELPAALINRASLQISQVTTFVGTVGIQNGNVAIQITGHSNKE
jgi:flagellar motor switch protein FliM